MNAINKAKEKGEVGDYQLTIATENGTQVTVTVSLRGNGTDAAVPGSDTDSGMIGANDVEKETGGKGFEIQEIKELCGIKGKDKDGNNIKEYLKVISKSNPLYQEFRIWQWLYNLKIYRKEDDEDVTLQFIANIEDKEQLFDFLSNRKSIEQKPLLEYLIKAKGLKKQVKTEAYRWNYVEDKIYPCSETKTMISTRLAKSRKIFQIISLQKK